MKYLKRYNNIESSYLKKIDIKNKIIKESLEEDTNYYFKHLEDDGFFIECEEDHFRIFKPLKLETRHVYSYSNCNPFHWSEIAGEISRYVNELDDSENSEKSIDYVYVIKRLDDYKTTRIQIEIQSLIDDTFDVGEILSFTIGFK